MKFTSVAEVRDIRSERQNIFFSSVHSQGVMRVTAGIYTGKMYFYKSSGKKDAST